jgi:hypothetical protein
MQSARPTQGGPLMQPEGLRYFPPPFDSER